MMDYLENIPAKTLYYGIKLLHSISFPTINRILFSRLSMADALSF